jgi:hypothetical protein
MVISMKREATKVLQRHAATFRVDLASRHEPSQDLGDFQVDQLRRVPRFSASKHARAHPRTDLRL